MSAGTLSLSATQEPLALSGAGLLGLVTTGMYDNPLSMYREYIQNAADAAAGRSFPGRARVDITVDVIRRRIKIRDNGPGLSRAEAFERLLPIGRSKKMPGMDRGFRGVGRLAGLAFAKTVSFTTRSCKDEYATRVTWHSDLLPEFTSTESELEHAILDCINVETLPGSDYPKHFFDVEVRDLALHSVELLLNRDAVRDYVGEVCPVSISSKFPFADKVEGLFNGTNAPLTLDVMLEGDIAPVERPYGDSIRLSTIKDADFTEFQEVRIPSVDDKCEAAVGWIAHSSYLGAIPREQRVRGIRVRVGNIQIGGEAVFDDLFVEERFNRWCVGEIHILDSRIIPNARRDYFQPGPHLRNLENQLSSVMRSISTRCRHESTVRNRARRALSSLSNIEDLYTLATSGYLTAQDSAELVQRASREVAELRESIDEGTLDNDTLDRLDSAEHKLTIPSVDTEQQRFGDLTPSEVAAYQRVFGALANLAPSPGSARELIEVVFAETSRVAQVDSGTDPDQRTGQEAQFRLALNDTGTLTPRSG